MEDDLNELARICLEQARVAPAPKVAAELRRMAKDYRRRAVRARSGCRHADVQGRAWRSAMVP
jgi:hypothetical protein